MKDPTNKELLEIILLQTKESAKKQFDFSCEMSIFANEQRDFNTEWFWKAACGCPGIATEHGT